MTQNIQARCGGLRCKGTSLGCGDYELLTDSKLLGIHLGWLLRNRNRQESGGFYPAEWRSYVLNMRELSTMWYAIQVESGKEELMIDLMNMLCSEQMDECFVVLRERRFKKNGVWTTKQEKLFKGYIFVVTDDPTALFFKLKSIPRLSRILGREGSEFFQLSEEEVEFLHRLSGDNHVASLSQVTISEGNQVKIVGGTLLGYTGQIVRINLHKKLATVRVEFMGRMVDMFLGIEILEKVEGN